VPPFHYDWKFLVDADEELGSVIVRAPVTMVMVVFDVGLMMAVVVPVTRLIVRPGIMVIVGQGRSGRCPAHDGEKGQQKHTFGEIVRFHPMNVAEGVPEVFDMS
jgi:hypothetical protein